MDLRTVDLTKEGLSRTTSVKSMPAAAPAEHVKSNPLDLRGRLHPAWMAVFVLIGAAAGWWLSQPTPAEPPISQQFQIIIDAVRNPAYVEASTDGRLLVIMGQDTSLTSYYTYIYDTTTGDLRTLNQNTGDRYFFSPDGTELAYRQGIKIYKVSVLGGTPVEVGRFGSGWPDWSPGGDLIFDWNESLWLHPQDGSDPVQISQVDSLAGEGGHYNADVLPGGNHAVMHIARTTGEIRQLAVLDLSSGEHRVIGNGASPTYAESGHLIYVDGSSSAQGQMLIRPFDLETLDFAGPPAVIEQNGAIGQWAFDRQGTAYYIRRPEATGWVAGQLFRFVEYDPASRNETPFAAPEYSDGFELSPNGKSIIVGIDPNGDGSTDFSTMVDRDTGISQRIPFESIPFDVSWASDSKSFYVGTSKELQRWSAETLRKEETWEAFGYPSTLDMSAEGKTAVYVNHNSGDWGRIRKLNLETGEDEILADGMYIGPRLSPDGRYVVALDLQLNLQIISLEDESMQPLSPSGEVVLGFEWASNGYIYYSGGQEIRRVRAATDPAFRVTNQPENLGSFPGLARFSVDAAGRVVALVNQNIASEDQSDLPTTLTVYTHWAQRANEMAPWDRQ